MKPTFLYIKQHTTTGLLYFGKTAALHPEKYKGSGRYWRAHLKKYGDSVETLWYCLFLDQEELSNFAIAFSRQQDIVISPSWANIIEENGLDGGPQGLRHSEEAKRNMSKAKVGKKMSPYHKLRSTLGHSKPCTIDGVKIYPTVVSLIAERGQGKNGLKHPNFKYIEKK